MTSSQAFESYTQRLLAFGREVPEDRDKQITGTLKTAGVTIMEARLLDAVKLSQYDIEEAKRLINVQISPKSLERSGIKPVTDIHKAIWRAAGKVLQGKVVVTVTA